GALTWRPERAARQRPGPERRCGRRASPGLSVPAARGHIPPIGGSSAVARRTGRKSQDRLRLAESSILPPIDEQDLQRSRDGYGGERAEDAGELGADQHGHEDCEGRQLNRAAVDERLKQLILDLLVDDEEDT